MSLDLRTKTLEWVDFVPQFCPPPSDFETQVKVVQSAFKFFWANVAEVCISLFGVNAFLPVIEEAGHHSYEQLMMPNCLKLAERCDAVLRIGGPSRGADQEVDVFSARELPVYHSVEDIPVAI